MRTGVLLPHSLTASSSHDLVTWARAAEDLGFDTLGVRGRIVRDSLEPLVALSLVAAATRRIEIVLNLPAGRRAQPCILTRQLSGLERASRRRLVVAGSAPDRTWAYAGRVGRRHCLTVVEVRGFEGGELDAVRNVLDVFERAGADGVLLQPASGDLAQLERLSTLRAPVLV